ncbi:MAG: CPBP family intramembrane metalloprotease [Deltaproteobacteria bacterium]|nr:MAG: CPBP family intramembrane metalloprotease [Deltaproteobacteria bacterium]
MRVLLHMSTSSRMPLPDRRSYGTIARQVKVMSRVRFLRLEWTLSFALIAVGLAWATLRGLPLASLCRPTARAIGSGATFGALLWLVMPVLFWAPGMRHVRDTVLVPFSRSLRTRDIVVIALLSGGSEEFFFRGVLMPEIGLGASSVLFGLLHAVNWVYVAWAALIGAGLGLLATHGGSLVAPAVAHATFNLGALLVLRGRQPPHDTTS